MPFRRVLPRLHLLLLALFIQPSSLDAQLLQRGRFALEPRIGVAFPKGDFGDVDPECPLQTAGCDYPAQTGTEVGWRWDARVHYFLTEGLSAIAGFGKAKMGCPATFCGAAPEPETRSVSLGLKGRFLALGNMDLWAELGGTLEKFSVVRTKNPQGGVEALRVWYPWSPGVYGGMGAELALTGQRDFFFTPGFSVRYIPADPPKEHSDLDSVAAYYLLTEIGFKVLLGR